jgi:hypothetical protein
LVVLLASPFARTSPAAEGPAVVDTEIEAPGCSASCVRRQWVERLLADGVSEARIVGFDEHGVPLLCGTGVSQPRPQSGRIAAPRALVPGTRGWETVPGVIRNDGIDSFRLEVDTNGPVASVVLQNIGAFGLVPPQPAPLSLRDDGVSPDAVAGDFVFSAGPFSWNPSVPMSGRLHGDPASPDGPQAVSVGTIVIEETGGETSEFLIGPNVGLLRYDIAEIPRTVLSEDVVVSSHLINVRTQGKFTQNFLHVGGSYLLPQLTNPIYEVVDDAFEFLMLISTNKIERIPRLTSSNFNAGIHLSTKVDYSGTGFGEFDNSARYGSAGRLLSINALDAYERGLYSGNATHEIVHQWSAYISEAFGLKSDPAHWSGYSNVESLLGGFRWLDAAGGSFVLDCDQGRNGATHAAPIDKYMMGTVDAGAVPTLMAYDENTTSPGLRCGADPPIPILPSEIVTTVAISEIQALHGVRTPGPDGARKDFRIGFVAESHERLLTATEHTFYEILAAHYATPVPAAEPDPYVGFNWVPVDRFFGEGTTWSADVPQTPVTVTTLLSTSTTVSTSMPPATSTTLKPADPCADATDDGVVTATDALAALQTAVGSNSCEACRCDVDGSGEITATDALVILRIAVGSFDVNGTGCPPCD